MRSRTARNGLFTLVLLTLVAVAGAAQAQPRHVLVPGVRVRVPPPAMRAEVRPARPSPNHLWIDGHWAWRGGGHVWVGGYWALPPAAGYVWEPARWVNEGGNWVFFEGHWRYEGAPAPAAAYYEPPPPAPAVPVQAAPPEPIVEVRPALPFAGAIWLPGYWHWSGATYVWIGGRWSAPRPGYVWESHRWERRGDHWEQVHGGWRRR